MTLSPTLACNTPRRHCLTLVQAGILEKPNLHNYIEYEAVCIKILWAKRVMLELQLRSPAALRTKTSPRRSHCQLSNYDFWPWNIS